MKIILLASMLTAAAFVLPLQAAEPGTTIELKDGTRIVLQKDGKTEHLDAKGAHLRMKDGLVMEGKDGEKYIMKNNAVWKQLTEKGTLAPNR